MRLCVDIARFAVAAALLMSAAWAQARQVSDARSDVFDFPKTPRAITLVPSITQNIYAIGAEDFLLGNSVFCKYPKRAEAKPKLGGFLNPDYAKIASLKPDVAVLPNGRGGAAIARKLESLGIPTFFTNAEGIENIPADIRLLGRLFDREAQAEEVAANFDKKLAEARKAAEGRGRRALFMFGEMAAGRGSFAGGLLEACGLANCADAAKSPWPILSREYILKSAPEVLFVEVADLSQSEKIAEKLRRDPIWAATPAVRNGKICPILRDDISYPSVRLLGALEAMRSFLRAN